MAQKKLSIGFVLKGQTSTKCVESTEMSLNIILNTLSENKMEKGNE